MACLLKGYGAGSRRTTRSPSGVIVSEMAAAILRTGPGDELPRFGRAVRRVSAKAGALVFVAVARHGNGGRGRQRARCRPRIQRAVSNALSHVSIPVPRPERRTEPIRSSRPTAGPTVAPRAVSPVGATGPVAPRGVQHGKDDGKTPRGATRNDDARLDGTPDNGSTRAATGDAVENKGSQRGLRNDDTQGNHNGDDNGQQNGADNGKKTGQTTARGQQDEACTVTRRPSSWGTARSRTRAKARTSNVGGNGSRNGNANSSRVAQGFRCQLGVLRPADAGGRSELSLPLQPAARSRPLSSFSLGWPSAVLEPPLSLSRRWYGCSSDSARQPARMRSAFPRRGRE